jgi:hypothetical protein
LQLNVFIRKLCECNEHRENEVFEIAFMRRKSECNEH